MRYFFLIMILFLSSCTDKEQIEHLSNRLDNLYREKASLSKRLDELEASFKIEKLISNHQYETIFPWVDLSFVGLQKTRCSGLLVAIKKIEQNSKILKVSGMILNQNSTKYDLITLYIRDNNFPQTETTATITNLFPGRAKNFEAYFQPEEMNSINQLSIDCEEIISYRLQLN